MTKDEKLRNLRRACRRAGWSNYVIREAERGSKRRVFAWSTCPKWEQRDGECEHGRIGYCSDCDSDEKRVIGDLKKKVEAQD